MELSTIGLIGGLAISGLTIISNVAINYIAKQKELKKEVLLKVMENSFKEYEFRTNHAISEAEKSGRVANLYPYDYYLIHFSQLAKLIEKRKLTEEAIKEVVESQRMFRAVYKGELERDE
jgi:hypothetical protein